MTAVALHSFHCPRSNQPGAVAGQRLRIVREFETNAGRRCAVADESGRVVAWQVPVEWLEVQA